LFSLNIEVTQVARHQNPPATSAFFPAGGGRFSYDPFFSPPALLMVGKVLLYVTAAIFRFSP